MSIILQLCFFKIFFLHGPFLKSLLNLLHYCFCFMFCFFGHKACRILAPKQGSNPYAPALEGEVLTIGPPGKSPSMLSYLAPRVCNLLCVLSHYRQEVLEDRNMFSFCTVLTCILSGTTIHCPNRTNCPGECLTLTENDIECLV